MIVYTEISCYKEIHS